MAHPIPHPHTSPPPPDGPPDLDALASHVYRPRHPLPARPRTSLLRVPWPGARDGLAPSASGAPRKQHQHLTVTRGGAAGALGSRRSTDVRHAAGISISGLAGGDGDQSESDDEGEEGGWEGEREEKWLDPRFAWAGRERQHKAAMPYPLSYGEALLNYQIATVDIIRRVKGSATYHLFERTQQPTKCLDIGCGTGTWIAAAAQEWPDCVFVGVDAAPVQPRIGRRSALYGRVSWVNCDWLEGLPFEEETFDHVHCWFVSSGVPETKWFDFFEEITRVMKPGATFEFVDEDIIFPALTKPAPSPRSSVNPAYAAAAAVAASASSASFASGSSTAAAGSTPSTTAPSVGDHSSINTSTVVGPGPGSAEALTLTRASGSGSSGSLGLSLRPTTSNGTSGTGSGSGTGTARTGGTGGPYTLSREELLGLPEEHDHSLIEKLFNEVFQGRGINMEPTGGVQMYINMYLMEVQSSPPLVFPAQAWAGKGAPRMPRYDTEGLSTLPNNAGLQHLSRQGFLPNMSFNTQHMISVQHTVGPQALAHVLAVREPMWDEYCRLRANEHPVLEQRQQERVEIRQRQQEREAELREGRLPPSIDLVGKEGSSSEKHLLIEHHQKVVEQESSRDAARLAELDRLDRASQEERIKIKSRLKGNMEDEVVVDRVQLAAGGMADWTDVTVVLGPKDRSRDREIFDILLDRYERDMRYRTQHTDVTARYLNRGEPPRTHLTGDELVRDEAWRRGFEEYMDRGNDEGLVWRRMRMYTATKSRRRLGTARAMRI